MGGIRLSSGCEGGLREILVWLDWLAWQDWQDWLD